MSARTIEAGGAYVRLFTKDGELHQGLTRAENRLRSFGNLSTKIGGLLTGAAAAMGAALIPTSAILAQFEQEMSAVKAVTRATAEDMEKLTAQARELGATTSFSASEAAQGMKYLGMAGFETEQILKGLPHVLALAKAGAVDLGVAADIASDVSSAFSLTAEEIKRVADVMAEAASSSNTSIEGLGESFKFAAPAGNAAGQSIEMVTAALGEMGNQGLKGSIAGRNLAIMFRQMARADVQKMLRQMNTEVADADGNFRSLLDILRAMKPAFDNLSSTEKVRFLSEAFGEAGKSAQMLISNLGGFEELTAKLDGSAGAAQRMADEMGNNLMGDWKAFLSAVQEIALSLGTGLSPQMREFTQTLTQNARSMGDWIKGNSAAIQVVVKLGVVAGVAGGSLLALGLAANQAAIAISALKGVMTAVAATHPGILALVAVLGALATAAGFALAAQSKLNAELERTAAIERELRDLAKKEADKTGQTREGETPDEARERIRQAIQAQEKNLETRERELREAQIRKQNLSQAGPEVVRASGVDHRIAKASERVNETRSLIESLTKDLGNIQDEVHGEGVAPKKGSPVKMPELPGFLKTVPGAFSPGLNSLGRAAQDFQDRKVRETAGKAGLEAIRHLSGFGPVMDTLGKVAGQIEVGKVARQLEETPEIVQRTSQRVSASQALEFGTAEAQRAIADALAPRVTIEQKALNVQEEIEEHTRESKSLLQALNESLRSGSVQLIVKGA